MHLNELTTPSLVLDRSRLLRNLARMRDHLRPHAVAFRPHLKTAKSAAIARLAVEGQAGGITVSTLAEAEYFTAHGFRDITLAAGITAAKLDRVMEASAAAILKSKVKDGLYPLEWQEPPRAEIHNYNTQLAALIALAACL